MNAPHRLLGNRLYALQLQPCDPDDPGRIAGQLEHVLSGRRHPFSDGPSLLACLIWDWALQGPVVSAPAVQAPLQATPTPVEHHAP